MCARVANALFHKICFWLIENKIFVAAGIRRSYILFSLILNISVKDCGPESFFILCMKISLFLLNRCIKGCQLNSFKTSLELVSYVLPVVTLAALFCSFCNLCKLYSEQLSQTKLQ